MKRLCTTAIAVALSALCFGQTSITIEECYRKARENYPLIRKLGLVEKTKEYNIDNLNKGYLPQLMFSSKATYQSDVTKIPIDLEAMGFKGVEIPHLSQDQYGISLDLNQTIWDGGAIKSSKEAVKSSSEVERSNIEVSLYAVNERINQIYFGILLADAQIEQNRVLKKILADSYAQVESYVKNGIANQSDLDAIRVDIIKSEQNEIDFLTARHTYIARRAKLTGMEIDEETKLVNTLPERPSQSDAFGRPEMSLFDAQVMKYRSDYNRINSGLYPRLSLFATGGYGKPGLDMFENKFAPYYIAGIKLNWNIGNFYSLKSQRKLIRNNIDMVENQRELFLFNTDIDKTQKELAIDKYMDQIKYDDEIIRLKTSIRKASEAKIANGTISGTDLMRDINSEHAAIQTKILHEIQLLLAIYDFKYVMNDF